MNASRRGQRTVSSESPLSTPSASAVLYRSPFEAMEAIASFESESPQTVSRTASSRVGPILKMSVHT